MTEQARVVAAPAERHIPGEAGMWVFIFAEMSMFTIFFVLYLHARSQDVEVFRTSQATLSQGYGALNTVILLTSSLSVFVGLQTIRRGRATIASKLFAVALALAAAFCVVKGFEWREKFSHDLVPSTNAFYEYYFIITGLHLFHVALGMGVLTALIVQASRTEISPTRMMVIEGGTVWWHMVDLNWMILFPLLYLTR